VIFIVKLPVAAVCNLHTVVVFVVVLLGFGNVTTQASLLGIKKNFLKLFSVCLICK
jgi:hypothetical protein